MMSREIAMSCGNTSRCFWLVEGLREALTLHRTFRRVFPPVTSKVNCSPAETTPYIFRTRLEY